MDTQIKSIWFYLSAAFSTLFILLSVLIPGYLYDSVSGFSGFAGLGILVIGYGLLFAAIDITLISILFFIDKLFKTKNTITFIYLLISRGFLFLKFVNDDNIVSLIVVVLTLLGSLILFIVNFNQEQKK